MSKVKIEGNASGTGTLTISAPNTDTDRTLTLPDADITLGGGVDGIDSSATGTAITIDSSGKVGIGTSSPDAKLKVVSTGANLLVGYGGTQNYFDASENYFRTFSGTTTMVIDSSGRVGINKSSSLEARLEARQTVSSQDGCIIDCNSSSFTRRVLVAQSNAGSGFFLMQGRNGGGEVYRVDGYQGTVYNTSNAYAGLSDERVKQNIVDANSQWDDIKALQIKNYKLKKDVNAEGDNAPTYLGVVAQDLEASGMNGLIDESKPEKEDVALHSDFGTVVEGTADNGATPIYDIDEEGNEVITGYKDIFTAGENKKEVKYSVLYMKAVKALQEAMERIETLESKVEALENA